MISVEYMNVGGSGDRCHEFLEWYRSEGVRVVFAEEAAAYRGGGTTTMAGYNILSRSGKGQRVVAYVAGEWEDRVELTYYNGTQTHTRAKPVSRTKYVSRIAELPPRG